MRRLRILVVGVGGQGILLFSRVLGEAALKAEIPVVMSEVHGMAQRGGVVETNIVLGGIRSPLISEGMADILIGLEPIETLRALPRTHKNTFILSSTDPIIPQIVKDGQAKYPDLESSLKNLKKTFPKVYLFPAQQLAKQAGISKGANIVTLGALAGSGLLPITSSIWEETLKKVIKPRYFQANLQAFEKGREIILNY